MHTKHLSGKEIKSEKNLGQFSWFWFSKVPIASRKLLKKSRPSDELQNICFPHEINKNKMPPAAKGFCLLNASSGLQFTRLIDKTRFHLSQFGGIIERNVIGNEKSREK